MCVFERARRGLGGSEPRTRIRVDPELIAEQQRGATRSGGITVGCVLVAALHEPYLGRVAAAFDVE